MDDARDSESFNFLAGQIPASREQDYADRATDAECWEPIIGLRCQAIHCCP